jgi:chromosome segregation ATPase
MTNWLLIGGIHVLQTYLVINILLFLNQVKDEMMKLEHKTVKENYQSEMKKCMDKIKQLKKEHKGTCEKIGMFEKELGDKSAQLEQQVCSLEEKDIMVEELKSEIETLNTEVRMLEKSRQESRNQLEKLGQEYEKKIAEKDMKKQEAVSIVEKILKAKKDEVNRLKKELEKRGLEKVSEIKKWRRVELERNYNIWQTEVENLKKEVIQLKLERDQLGNSKQMKAGKVWRMKQDEIDKIKKDWQTEVKNLKKEWINLKVELDQVCKMKQGEINNIEKRKKIELEKLYKRKDEEIQKMKKEKDDEIKKIKSSQQEEDMSKTKETKVSERI